MTSYLLISVKPLP